MCVAGLIVHRANINKRSQFFSMKELYIHETNLTPVRFVYLIV